MRESLKKETNGAKELCKSAGSVSAVTLVVLSPANFVSPCGDDCFDEVTRSIIGHDFT